MQYRKFGRESWQVSALGIGTAGLPTDDGQALEVLSQAVRSGVNYIEVRYNDTRYSEAEERLCRLSAQALGKSGSSGVRVAVNLPSRNFSGAVEIGGFLNKRAEWLAAGSVDYLQFDGLDRATWPALQASGLLDGARKSLADGLLRGVGFSFRDQFLYLKPVIEGFNRWSFCRFQYSFMDADHLPGTAALSYAAGAGLAVVAGGPLKQGRLAQHVPDDAAVLWQTDDPAEQALRWVWNHPQVAVAVVDAVAPQQVARYAAVAAEVQPESLSIADEVRISRVRDAYRTRRTVNCTGCRACMPCRHGIDAPRIFELYNDALVYQDRETPASSFWFEEHDISRCDNCGECVGRCGRGIDILEQLREAAGVLEKEL